MSEVALNFDISSRIVGQLFGNILHRDSDLAGYDYYLRQLENKQVTLEDLIFEFYVSEEFVRTFVVNETPNQLVRNLISTFFVPDLATVEWVKDPLDILIRKGLEAAIRYFLSDSRYQDRHGPQSVPRYATAHGFAF